MKEIKITKKQLLKKYNNFVDNILNDCNWKTSFTGEIIYELLTT